MSKIGKLPIIIPSGVVVEIVGLFVRVVGPCGVLEKEFSGDILITSNGSCVVVMPLSSSGSTTPMWGTARSIISSMILGVQKKFAIILELSGVAYRANIEDKWLNLNLGYSHSIKYQIPSNVFVSVPTPDSLLLESINKEKLGQVAAEIMSLRPVEPYKGKGILVKGSHFERKEGKKKG